MRQKAAAARESPHPRARAHACIFCSVEAEVPAVPDPALCADPAGSAKIAVCADPRATTGATNTSWASKRACYLFGFIFFAVDLKVFRLRTIFTRLATIRSEGSDRLITMESWEIEVDFAYYVFGCPSFLCT